MAGKTRHVVNFKRLGKNFGANRCRLRWDGGEDPLDWEGIRSKLTSAKNFQCKTGNNRCNLNKNQPEKCEDLKDKLLAMNWDVKTGKKSQKVIYTLTSSSKGDTLIVNSQTISKPLRVSVAWYQEGFNTSSLSYQESGATLGGKSDTMFFYPRFKTVIQRIASEPKLDGVTNITVEGDVKSNGLRAQHWGAAPAPWDIDLYSTSEVKLTFTKHDETIEEVSIERDNETKQFPSDKLAAQLDKITFDANGSMLYAKLDIKVYEDSAAGQSNNGNDTTTTAAPSGSTTTTAAPSGTTTTAAPSGSTTTTAAPSGSTTTPPPSSSAITVNIHKMAWDKYDYEEADLVDTVQFEPSSDEKLTVENILKVANVGKEITKSKLWVASEWYQLVLSDWVLDDYVEDKELDLYVRPDIDVETAKWWVLGIACACCACCILLLVLAGR
jgi:hypothetical protein